ncbi:MAG: Nramp family divalent metal transporter [Bryobacterales bacterium]
MGRFGQPAIRFTKIPPLPYNRVSAVDPERPSWYRTIAPGILLAATGVGAGDLLTSTLAGSEAGLGVLWCVAVGALLKWALTEGLARWQLSTGTTLLEGWTWKLGGWIRWVFLAYILMFTVIVGRALASACGVAGTGFFPIGEPSQSVFVWGVIHSLVGMALVLFGSFALFEVLMSVLIGLMFVTVVLTAVVIQPDWAAMAAGFVPSIPEQGSHWVLAVLGGVEEPSRCSPTATGFASRAGASAGCSRSAAWT